MKTTTLEVLLFVLVNLCTSLKLPTGFKKCDKNSANFDECLSHAIQDAIKLLDKPYPEYGLPNLEPLILPQNLEIGNSTGGVKQKYSNIRMSGLTKVTNTKARMDFESSTLNLEVSLSEFQVNADVQLIGNLIILPLNSSATLACTYIKPVFKFKFELSKDGQYYKIIKADLDLLNDGISFEYTNIFQSKALSDAFNAELNANWKRIFDYLWNKYSNIFTLLYASIFSNLLKQVPIADLFDGVTA